ncbi:MAG: hypothetical protein LUG83_07565 [Lachnospiraceae bacterium]|nr:hypothetical protein [Lachnospiraceae bacterium]
MEFDELTDPYHIPKICEKCGGVYVFEGVGEYHCEKCGNLQYDDYGKVRLYIEQHPGANAAEVENATGVSQRSIRRMLKENRIEVADSSKVTLFCESCGKSIRSGRFCPQCEVKYHQKIEESQRRKSDHDMKGFGLNKGGEEGQRRFIRK